MKQSLTFYITLFAIKLKGLKRNFSTVPIDFKKIRKADVSYPTGKFYEQNTIRNFNILNSSITEIGLDPDSEKLLIFIHGGAFISGPTQHHWNFAKKIAKKTDYKIWICNYPKAPENNIIKISQNIDSIYFAALEKYNSNQISLIGDSVGGTLIISLIQRLVLKKLKLPAKIILLSPVMDASMTNPEIEKLNSVDPILSKIGVVSAKIMCVGEYGLKNTMISPLYGSFEKFPHTILFLAKNDITYPDQKLAVQKLIEAKINVELIEGKNMPHIWPILPIMKEAKIALNEIIKILNV